MPRRTFPIFLLFLSLLTGGCHTAPETKPAAPEAAPSEPALSCPCQSAADCYEQGMDAVSRGKPERYIPAFTCGCLRFELGDGCYMLGIAYWSRYEVNQETVFKDTALKAWDIGCSYGNDLSCGKIEELGPPPKASAPKP